MKRLTIYTRSVRLQGYQDISRLDVVPFSDLLDDLVLKERGIVGSQG